MQMTLGFEPEQEAVMTPAVQQKAAHPPVAVHQHPVIGETVKQLIADGTLDFLEVTRLAPGVKEPKVAKKRFGKPKYFGRKAAER